MNLNLSIFQLKKLVKLSSIGLLGLILSNSLNSSICSNILNKNQTPTIIISTDKLFELRSESREPVDKLQDGSYLKLPGFGQIYRTKVFNAEKFAQSVLGLVASRAIGKPLRESEIHALLRILIGISNDKQAKILWSTLREVYLPLFKSINTNPRFIPVLAEILREYNRPFYTSVKQTLEDIVTNVGVVKLFEENYITSLVASRLVADYMLNGIIIFAKNYSTREEVKNLEFETYPSMNLDALVQEIIARKTLEEGNDFKYILEATYRSLYEIPELSKKGEVLKREINDQIKAEDLKQVFKQLYAKPKTTLKF